jgi:hypothetical protein
MPSLAAAIEDRRRPLSALISAHKIPLPGNDRTHFQRLVCNSPETGSQGHSPLVPATLSRESVPAIRTDGLVSLSWSLIPMPVARIPLYAWTKPAPVALSTPTPAASPEALEPVVTSKQALIRVNRNVDALRPHPHQPAKVRTLPTRVNAVYSTTGEIRRGDCAVISKKCAPDRDHSRLASRPANWPDTVCRIAGREDEQKFESVLAIGLVLPANPLRINIPRGRFGA